MRLPRAAGAVAAALLLSAAVHLRATADLDSTFGSGGKVVTDLSGRYDEARAIAIQPDGRIVAAGLSGTDAARDFALARYNPDGHLDRTFGAAGTVTTDVSGRRDEAWALAIQPDGRILAGGEADTDFGLSRYDAAGTLDPRFGAGGKAVTDLGGDDRINAMALQADGKVVVAGIARGHDFALARYDADGTLDATFGNEGRVIADFNGESAAAWAVAARADGVIVAAGLVGSFPTARFAVVRYNPDGSLDSSFDGDGAATVVFSRDARAHALRLQEDGSILVGGIIQNGSSSDAAVARLTANGSLDVSFGTGGRVLTDFGGRNFGSALVLQDDGRIVVAGADDTQPYYDFVAARYEPDGRPDVTFGNDGRLLTEFGGNSWINAVAVQPDGRIVAAGYARAGSGADFALVRYESGR
jgi:uncharacterized delta-60 repeat protein